MDRAVDKKQKPDRTEAPIKLNREVGKTETHHILKSRINAERLQDAIDEMNRGVYYQHAIIET